MEELMSTYRLPNGREVFLVRWKMVRTYSGWLEGSPKAISNWMRKNLPKLAAEMLPPGHPLAVIGPPKGELPRWLCLVELESPRGIHNADPDFNSRLFVCWFMADTARSLDEIIEALLPELDWEKLAEDYDLTFI
jgi:hypothetical protein